MRRFIGLMSGTSLDAVDGVLAEVGPGPTALRTVAFASRPLEAPLRDEFEALQSPGTDELARAARASAALARVYAAVVADLLAATRCPAAGVTAIGAHGQTVRHRPDLGFTIQLLDAARLAEDCGIPVVSDLRAADVAAAGQGAPLVPAFHARVFAHPRERRAIVNLGGIANVSLLPPAGTEGDAAGNAAGNAGGNAGDDTGGDAVLGFDTGPANTLLDLWARRHLGTPFDRDGAWARGGRPDAALLAAWLAEPYFALAPPKSTGRDLFDAAWLERSLATRTGAPPAPRDVQATLAELTAVTVARACRDFGAQRVYVCGGGAANGHLLERLAAHVAPAPVETTLALGVDPQAVEAAAFAWLAARRIDGLPGNLPAVTGARGPRVLGTLAEPLPRA